MSMTAEQIRERATQRAKDEGLKAWKLMDGTYAVRSRTLAPGAFHVVTVTTNGSALCDAQCPGFTYRRSCSHVAAVERRLSREQRAAFAF